MDKKQVTEEYIQYNSIYIKFKLRQNKITCTVTYTLNCKGIVTTTKFKAVVTSRKDTQETSKELVFYSFGA